MSLGIEGCPSPIRAAVGAGKQYRGLDPYRREQSSENRSFDQFPAVRSRFRRYIRQVFGAETLAYERRRLDGERLGRVGRFTRNVAGRDRPFDDLEQRLTGGALKQESKAGLGNLRDRVHRFALAEDG